MEAHQLHLAADGEEELEQVDAVAHEQRLELGRVAQEDAYLLLGAKAHHALDAGAVVPGAVEQHDVAAGRQVGDVALEVPLAALGLGRLGERDGAGVARVEARQEAADAAALAGGVASLEQHDEALAARSRCGSAA